MKPFFCLGTLGLCAAAASAASWEDVLQTFSSPGPGYRPKFRYWLADATADPQAIRDDIRAMASVGAGGFEFLPYYQIGSVPSSDWSEYAYGSKASREIFRAAMETAEEEGLLMDFAVAVNQGQGVPAEPGTLGLAVHLAYANVTVVPGQTFNGTLPLSSQPSAVELYFMHELEEFGEQELVAVIAVETSPEDTDIDGYTKINRTIDLTSEVDKETRSLLWQTPVSAPGSGWRIMAWYERHTNQRSISGGDDPSNYLQNGSWIVDHFSAKGSNLMTKFFDDHIVPDQEDRDLLARVGGYAWEDSMEMNSVLWWTPEFETKFLGQWGYDIRGCLPFLVNQENSWAQGHLQYGEGFLSANASIGTKCNHDYRQVLQRGYEEYVQASIDWAHARGVKYSNQPAYNLPLSMGDSALLPDAPEVESFGFDDSIDGYRHMSGPAHMTGNPVISSELGAIPGAAYSQTLSQLLHSFHRGLAGGISMNVLHGYPYSGPVAGTTWPGLTIFSFMFSEMWGVRQPMWRNFPDLLEYMARSQFLIQDGVPRVDLAFYSNDSPWSSESGYRSDNLQDAFYTYEYLGPASLKSDSALVRGGVLAPDGPAYKALVFSNQTLISFETASKVLGFAREGLPIVFIGDIKIGDSGHAGAAEAIMDQVRTGRFTNVIIVPSADDLVDTLHDAQIFPNIQLPGNHSARGWHSFWRSTEHADIVWLYYEGDGGDSAAAALDLTFPGMGGTTPFRFDAWTGEVEPILHYTRRHDCLTIPTSLLSNQPTVIAFQKDDSNPGATQQPANSIVFISESVVAISHLKGPTGAIQPAAQLLDGLSTVELSNGTTLSFNASQSSPLSLDHWNIEIQSWRRNNEDSMDTAIDVFNYVNTTLVSWIELDPENLSEVSGIGYYSTHFDTPRSDGNKRLGARLHMGVFHDTLKVRINGAALPSHLDQSINDTIIDISQHLRSPGASHTLTNQLEVEVATTLFNRLKAEANITLSLGVPADSPQGSGPYFAQTPAIENGLLGPAWVEWVEIAEISL